MKGLVKHAIKSFKSGDYTVTRYGADSFENGLRDSGSGSTFEIEASVQPLSGRDLQMLSDAERVLETRALYTDAELFVRRGEKAADTVAIEGESWRVFKVERWPSYTKALVARGGQP